MNDKALLRSRLRAKNIHHGSSLWTDWSIITNPGLYERVFNALGYKNESRLAELSLPYTTETIFAKLRDFKKDIAGNRLKKFLFYVEHAREDKERRQLLYP